MFEIVIANFILVKMLVDDYLGFGSLKILKLLIIFKWVDRIEWDTIL